jgi:DNA-binding transcriptional ArsR family regulator
MRVHDLTQGSDLAGLWDVDLVVGDVDLGLVPPFCAHAHELSSDTIYVQTKISGRKGKVERLLKFSQVDSVQVIAEPRRRDILRLVWDDDLSASQIADRFPVTFGAISQHLKVVRDAGLVILRKEGTKHYYRADREAMGPLAEYRQSMWAASLDTLATLAERSEADSHRRPRDHGTT